VVLEVAVVLVQGLHLLAVLVTHPLLLQCKDMLGALVLEGLVVVAAVVQVVLAAPALQAHHSGLAVLELLTRLLEPLQPTRLVVKVIHSLQIKLVLQALVMVEILRKATLLARLTAALAL
jgi:hypothetical protein